MTSPTPTVPAADLLRVIAECAEGVPDRAFVNRLYHEIAITASPPRGGDGAGEVREEPKACLHPGFQREIRLGGQEWCLRCNTHIATYERRAQPIPGDDRRCGRTNIGCARRSGSTGPW